MARRRILGPAGLAIGAVCAGTVLAACGSGGTALARQACGLVDQSVAQLSRASHASSAAAASADQQRAYVDLRRALPIAASANSADGEWNALMTTISESARVPEQHLVAALRSQCQLAFSANPQDAPPVPLTVPGGSGKSPSTTTTSLAPGSTTTTAPPGVNATGPSSGARASGTSGG